MIFIFFPFEKERKALQEYLQMLQPVSFLNFILTGPITIATQT